MASRLWLTGVNEFCRWRQVLLPVLKLHHWSTIAPSMAAAILAGKSPVSGGREF